MKLKTFALSVIWVNYLTGNMMHSLAVIKNVSSEEEALGFAIKDEKSKGDMKDYNYSSHLVQEIDSVSHSN